jgi:hypothetical protein
MQNVKYSIIGRGENQITLYERKYNHDKKNAIGLGTECAICLDKKTDVMYGMCHHTLCSDCFIKWNSENNECPHCRATNKYNSYAVHIKKEENNELVYANL